MLIFLTMWAVVEIGKKQYLVKKNEVIKVQRLKEAKDYTFDKVLLIADKAKVSVGSPYVSGAKVKASFQGERKARKVIVYKSKRRKKYRKTQGHRQIYTILKISDISASSSRRSTKKESE